MIPLDTLRAAIGMHLGEVLTPERATDIVMKAVGGIDSPIDLAQFPTQIRPDGYRFGVERFHDVVHELEPLHAQHFAETERYRAHQGLAPDLLAMEADDRAGRMLQFTLRDPAGRLVGNIRLYLFNSRHTGARCAREDTFYVLPDHRRGLLALRFWQFAERCVASIGVVEIRTDSKRATGVGRLNEYLGYEAVATTYIKNLEVPHVR